MTKKQVLLFIPLLFIAGFLLYTWITILTGDYSVIWRHYTGLILFAPLIYFFTKNYRIALLGTVIYLILGCCNVLILTPSTKWTSYGIHIGSANIETPPFQLLSFGLLMLLCILNFDTLADIYFDLKEIRQTKMKDYIQVDNEKVLIAGRTFKKEISWIEITQINTFKRDFLTWDRVELEIVYGNKSLTINEDIEGWNAFVSKSKELFTSIPQDWDTTIIHPPFETNFRNIYSKG